MEPNSFKFKDYCEETNLEGNSLTGISQLASGIASGISAYTFTLPLLTLLSFDFSREDVEIFQEQVTNYATSNEVISQISEQVGEPKIDETEDEFVERASQALRRILTEKFKI